MSLLLLLQGLVEEFDRFDDKVWDVAYRQWGGETVGGVVPENVSIRDGKLILEAHGDRYNGPVKGINADLTERPHGRRVGSAIATRKQWGSGRFEVRMKAAPVLGACSAIWTFYYRWNEGREPDNHEIDIELPGRPREVHRDIDFRHALCNTFLTPEKKVTTGYTKLAAPQVDGEFHTYRFDWHTGGGAEKRRVDFFVDDVAVRTIETNVPVQAGRFWIGVWCPPAFTGPADFDTARMEVAWVKITPFNEPGDKIDEEPPEPKKWVAAPGPRKSS